MKDITAQNRRKMTEKPASPRQAGAPRWLMMVRARRPVKAGLRPPPSAAHGLDRPSRPDLVRHHDIRRRSLADTFAIAQTKKKGNDYMLTHPTLDQMLSLGLAGMATAYRELANQARGNDLSFDDREIAPCSVELYEAVVAVNDVKRPSQFGQERDCWSAFRSERPARPAEQGVACRL
jgi:pyruvate/2-oxoglutarate dehydrogenase complex dihydrolipoamide acyltransferase (E2) component